MEFLDISSLGVAYRYVVEVKQKFKQKFGSDNLPQQKQGKCNLSSQNKGKSKDNQPQEKHSKP